MISYWRGKSFSDVASLRVPSALKDITEIILSSSIEVPSGSSAFANVHLAHYVPGYEKILTKGLNGLISEVEKAIDRLDLTKVEDLKKLSFWRL